MATDSGGATLVTIPGGGGGAFVRLQGTTPGTVDTGNHYVSGVGIMGTRLLVGETAPTVSGLSAEAVGGNVRFAGASNFKLFLSCPGVAATDGAGVRFGNDTGEDKARVKLASSTVAAPAVASEMQYLVNDAAQAHTFYTSSLPRMRVEPVASPVWGVSLRSGSNTGIGQSVPLFLVGQDGAAFTNSSIESYTRTTGRTSDFILRHGAATATGLGDPRMLVTDNLTGAQMVFGNVATFSANPTPPQFQFRGHPDQIGVVMTLISSETADPNGVYTRLSFRSPDIGMTNEGVSIGARGVGAGIENDLDIVVGGVSKIYMPGAGPTNLKLQPLSTFPGVDGEATKITFVAQDSADAVSEASLGIESVLGSPGDAVLRTGAGVERVRVLGVNGTSLFTAQQVSISTPTPLSADSPVTFDMAGTKGDGSASGGEIRSLTGVEVGSLGGLALNGYNGSTFYMLDDMRAIFADSLDLSLAPASTLFSVIDAGVGNALFASSASGISGLFQTSVTDGSNASPTLAARANTGQTSPVLDIQDDGFLPWATFRTDGGGPTLLISSTTDNAISANSTDGLALNVFGVYGGIRARATSGSSGEFRSGVNDGSNTEPTVDILGNTLQTANLTNWRGTDGSTLVAHVGIDGTVDAAAYSVGSLYVVDATGNLTKIKGVTLDWPAANAAGVLTNDGSGNLSWT